MAETFRESKNHHETGVETQNNTTAVLDGTLEKQTAVIEKKKSRVGKFFAAALGTSVAAKGAGTGLVISEGGKVDAAHDVITTSSHSVGTGVGFGLMEAGSAGFAATALVGLGMLLRRAINANRITSK